MVEAGTEGPGGEETAWGLTRLGGGTAQPAADCPEEALGRVFCFVFRAEGVGLTYRPGKATVLNLRLNSSVFQPSGGSGLVVLKNIPGDGSPSPSHPPPSWLGPSSLFSPWQGSGWARVRPGEGPARPCPPCPHLPPPPGAPQSQPAPWPAVRWCSC